MIGRAIGWVLVLAVGLASSTPSQRILERPGRIVDGKAADPGEIPWQAGIFQKGSKQIRCGGVFIAPNFVLSAAHCANAIPAVKMGVMGGTCNASDFSYVWDVVSVHKFNYSTTSKQNDFVVVELDNTTDRSADAMKSGTIQTIEMAPVDFVAEGRNCLVSGWGLLSSGGTQPQELRRVHVDVHTAEKCEEMYKGHTSIFRGEKMLCAGGGTKDACQGDSGGPLTCMDDNGKRYLAGVVSWGIGCATKKVPGAYCKIYNPRYKELIEQTMARINYTRSLNRN